MSVKITRDMNKIAQKISAGTQAMKIAVTESVIEYGNEFAPQDHGVLIASSLIGSTVPNKVSKNNWTDEDKKIYSAASGSDPKNGLAVWDTPYAKKRYYTGTPSKDVNSNASLMWAEKGVKTYKKELDKIAQNAFSKGMKGENK